MVTATQLQILQSPIVNLISTISASVTVKLDDSNYLNWNFLIQLLLESNGIFGFVDGSHPCPSSSDEFGTLVPNSSSSAIDCDDVLIWKMHDRAIMQLITATLSPVAMSCAIGSRSSKDLWNRLKEQFSTVSKTSIFQLKSNLQNIKKGTDSISQYLLKIKEARDYLSAAGVHFADEDIVILALNGLPSEYNTFRCVIRGRENVIALREFRSQLLAEELIVESSMSTNPTYLAAMNTTSKNSPPFFQPPRGQQGYNSYDNNGYRSFNRGRGRSKFGQGQRPYAQRAQFPVKSQSIGPLSNSYRPSPMSNVPICQLCNNEGHTAPVCGFRGSDKPNCTLCGMMNHTTWYCYYNENGPNFVNSANQPSPVPPKHQVHHAQALHTMHNDYSSVQQQPLHTGYSMPQPMHAGYSLSPALHTVNTGYSSSQQQPVHTGYSMAQQTNTQPSPQVWITDSGATNHMTADMSNLSLSTTYPSNDSVHTANGEGQSLREDNVQRTLQ